MSCAAWRRSWAVPQITWSVCMNRLLAMKLDTCATLKPGRRGEQGGWFLRSRASLLAFSFTYPRPPAAFVGTFLLDTFSLLPLPCSLRITGLEATCVSFVWIRHASTPLLREPHTARSGSRDALPSGSLHY